MPCKASFVHLTLKSEHHHDFQVSVHSNPVVGCCRATLEKNKCGENSILLDNCLMTFYIVFIIDFGECHPTATRFTIATRIQDHLGSHPGFFLQEGDKYVGLEEFKQAVPLLKAGGQWEKLYWLRLHVVF